MEVLFVCVLKLLHHAQPHQPYKQKKNYQPKNTTYYSIHTSQYD